MLTEHQLQMSFFPQVERISKSRSGSASRASNRNANLPTPQENVQQNCGDINANDTNTAGS